MVFLNQLTAKFFLIGRGLISHVKNLVARANVLLWIAVTIDAPVHVQRILFICKWHLVHAAVAGGATDALVEVDAVIEVYKIRQVVYARPFNRFAAAITGAYRLENLGVGPNLRVTAHANLGGWNSSKRRRLDGCMTIPAIDAVVSDVMLMAEGNRLRLYHVDIRDVGAPVHGVGEGDQPARSKYRTSKAYFGKCVRASMEDLSHAA